jgi:hypothetical protein
VSGTTSSDKKLMLVSGRAYPQLAEEVAACLGIKLTPTKLFDFASGEIFVRFLDSVRGCDVFVLQSHTAPPGQEELGQGADLGAAHGGPVRDGGRRPADGRRPAHRPDPGFLRRPG